MSVEVRKATFLKVGCPYCTVGHALVEVTHRDGADTMEGVKDPRRCNTCNRWFSLKLQVRVLGVALATPQPAPTQGELLRSMLNLERT